MFDPQAYGLIQVPAIRYTRNDETTWLKYGSADERDGRLAELQKRSEAVAVGCRAWAIGDNLATGIKAFDAQTDLITTGNVCARTQYSTCVRATKDKECNGFTFGDKELFARDVAHLQTIRGGEIFRFMERMKRTEAGFPGGVAYLFRYFDSRRPVVVGGILTDRHGRCLRRISREDVGLRASAQASRALDVLECLVTEKMEVQ